MLAEIFILQLESRLLSEKKDAAQAETPRYVPLPAQPQKGSVLARADEG
jgi:hypothetical protein